MLVDSEQPVADAERPWDHLQQRDHWERPPEAADEQVLLLTTCMETWVVSDRETLREHYGHQLQENALPPLAGIENRDRHVVQDALVHATRNCKNAYAKGRRSFEVVGKLQPAALDELPAFKRAIRILKSKERQAFTLTHRLTPRPPAI